MKFNEVKISIGRTVNLKNYEFGRYDITLSAVINSDDNETEVIDAVKDRCKKELDKLIYGDNSDEFDGFVF